MDLRQLEVFINLAESLNYSKTAENLHLSQPAVSRIIQRIEGEVGVTLFYRNHREVQLTKNGKLFYDDSKSLTNSYNKALQRTRNSFNREQSNLTIGITDTPLEQAILPEMIKAFHREYPNCKIFLEGFDHNRLKHHLIDHDSDVIFTTHDDITDLAEVKYYHLFSGHFMAIVPADHHLSDREELELDDLAGEKILLMDNNWCPPEQLKLQETIRKKVDDLDISHVNDVEIVSLMVKAGLGITVMPSFVAIEKADVIKAVKLNYPALLDYGLVCRKDEADPLVIAFCQVMQEQAEGM
ncbi:LysR family transcriptional regulator [Lactobacillus delbrueckii]|nr:LysR family transcriptional regulator [Lactobacillus delbrueckii]MCD5434493.1 LysR family transcriptional regulator [Lactobacillus delbrueckii subsp. lactis]MCD5435723.1 LysR family transcriptional regulator [Lactobacillus delbrueckii subsp. lactis]MCD5492687.1 LysR family transcriptional regulator [Lactobacillus delbrueckii subsp. lactis]MCD5537258.1 LysR family transcriptional regulator [Lactobacillus delbrueckii subsp. lactis]MCT3486098.1 LysR family transcriptional regulator [Lactobacil